MKKDIISFDYEGLKKKKLKYFTFQDAIWSDKNGKLIKDNIWMYMINIDKNTGKTTELLRMLNECCKKIKEVVEWNNDHPDDKKEIEDRFVIIFRSKENQDEMNSEYNNVDNILFKYEGKRYRLRDYPDIVVGKSTFLGTGLEKSNGQQFKGYKYLFFDEYRSKTPLSERQRKMEFPMLGRFISTFQRDKKGIYFYLFGNNEAGADIIAESFNISKDTKYYINIEEGLAYFNFGGCFTGLRKEQKQVGLFTKYSKQLKDYIDNNVAMESKKGMISKKEFDGIEKELVFQVMFRGNYFNFYQNNKGYYVEGAEQNKDILCYGLLSIDVQENQYLKLMDEKFLQDLEDFFRNDLIKLWRIMDRDNLSDLMLKGLKILRIHQELGLML
ncbi:MAG: hypothetical protein ACRCUM_02355 [Mycoplasmoidaceae bacterium]